MVKDKNKNLTTKAPRKAKQNIKFFLVNLGVLGAVVVRTSSLTNC
jgi:hypothetical protein